MAKRSYSASPRVVKLSRRNSSSAESYATTVSDVWETVGACAPTMDIGAVAIKLYEMCLNHHPSSIKALIGWSKLLRLNDISFNETVGTQAALCRLTEATDRFPELAKSYEIYMELTECYLLLGLTDQAHQTIQHALVLQPNITELRLLLGQTLVRAGLLVPAAASLKRAIALLPPSISEYLTKNVEVARKAHAELAAVAAADGNFGTAIEELKLTLQLPPPQLARLNEYVALWCALLTALERAGRIPEALEACEQAELKVGSSPRITITHAYLLLLEEDKEKAYEAVRLLNHVVRLEQQETAQLEPQNDQQRKSDNQVDAKGDFLPWCLLGKAYTVLGSPRAAYDSYQIALRIASLLPITWLAVGKLFLELKQLPDALAAFSQALRLQLNEDLPGTAAAWDGLGCVYERCDQQLTDAADSCSRASACFAAYGDTESAREYKERAQKLKDAAEGKGSVPPLKSPMGVPNNFLRDLVTLLPCERIALIQQAKAGENASATASGASVAHRANGAVASGSPNVSQHVSGTSGANGATSANDANGNGKTVSPNTATATVHPKTAVEDATGRPGHPKLLNGSAVAQMQPQYYSMPGIPPGHAHLASPGSYGAYKPNDNLPMQMVHSFPPERPMWPGQEHLAEQPYILHGPPPLHTQFGPLPKEMYLQGQLGPHRLPMIPAILAEGYPVAGSHGYLYGPKIPVAGGMLAQMQPYNWHRWT